MFDTWLWVVFTLLAAAGQTARNAMQRELTASLGTVGATHVRFLFGFPFALLFLAGVADLLRLRAAAPVAELHPVAARGRAVPDRRDRHDARRDGAALVRRRRCLHQDRTDPGRDLRRDLPRRGRQPADDGGDRHRDRRRGGHVLQAGRHDRRHQADDHRARVRRHVRAVGHRLSRRDPRPQTIRTS